MRRRIVGLAAAAAIILTITGPVAAAADTAPSLPSGLTQTAAPDGAAPVYRFYSPIFKGHFYTIDPAERDRVIRTWPNDWTYEGERYTAFPTQVAGTVPLYRFWSDKFKGHFYTADETEKNHVIATWPADWSFEGVAYYVYPVDSPVPDTLPMYRFWGPKVLHHFYTADNGERDRVISLWPHDWSYERARFRVPAAGVVTTATPARPADVDCTDFSNWAAAQAYFGKYYAYYGDIARLDGDGDLIACESLPGAPRG
ncbi:excalibur calcium-binding domain-containing protein [Microbacterium binotii]|uniref:excalibur calcium-binding domain-containing protein n=1 Tax=Microbacterium binotii TaxID=462710 RepID=UPI001F244171|nr:excalibur calcium-binding domain-containing protein [Microbacterium binotii]UIN31948.1 excalibur calcium-binding domain-containing protein [Microbacterium binotii]